MQKEIIRHQDLPYFPTQIQPTSVWTRRLCRRPTECSPWYQCECRWGLRSSCHWLLLIHHILQNMRFCLLKWFQVPPQQQKIVQVWIRTATYVHKPMFPNMMPFSVEATFTLALMLAKSWGASVRGDGFSTNLRSPGYWRTCSVKHAPNKYNRGFLRIKGTTCTKCRQLQGTVL